MSIVRVALSVATQRLTAYLSNTVNAQQEAQWLLCHVLECTPTQLHTNAKQELTVHEQKLLNHTLSRRTVGNEPLAYIIGTIPFADLTLAIKQPVLIPRPETEQMVMWVIEQIKQHAPGTPLRILDLCTGSGCIALALAHHLPHIEIVGVDISQAAIALAEKNAQACGLKNVTFVTGDVLRTQLELPASYAKATDPKDPAVLFNIIISNPPYISIAEYNDLDASVREWEDEHALLADDNGLLFYKKITELAPQLLTKPINGLPSLIFEIGHTQKKAVSDIVTTHHFSNVVCHQDLFANDRWISTHIFL